MPHHEHAIDRIGEYGLLSRGSVITQPLNEGIIVKGL
jgi:hypothetical protein